MNKFLDTIKPDIRNLRDERHILQNDKPQSGKGQIKNIKTFILGQFYPYFTGLNYLLYQINFNALSYITYQINFNALSYITHKMIHLTPNHISNSIYFEILKKLSNIHMV